MDDVERAIRHSLAAEDTELFDRLGADQALHRQVLATLQGRLRWFNAACWIAGFVLFAVGCFLAWRFAQAQQIGDMLRWGVGARVCWSRPRPD
jgi:hypothetical protein